MKKNQKVLQLSLASPNMSLKHHYQCQNLLENMLSFKFSNCQGMQRCLYFLFRKLLICQLKQTQSGQK